MTHREKVIVSAYTGILMCDFSDVHEYIEKILERPVWTHEMADKKIWDEIKAASQSDFIAICEAKEDEEERRRFPDLESYNEVFNCSLSKEAFDAIMGKPLKIQNADELIYVDPDTHEKIVFKRVPEEVPS